ncbi:hypothetical protein Holit_01595 [Hollandina sp. SP2]
MNDTYLTIRFESPLKKRIETLAKVEKRTMANQAALLIEKGLLAFDAERGSKVGWGEPPTQVGKTA